MAEPENLAAYPWFHGSISRAETDRRLTPKSVNGLFLMRLSSNHPGDLTLCVVFGGQVSHYHVKKVTFPKSVGQAVARHYYTIDEESRFYPLDLLVQHYQSDADGLCCQLTRGVDVAQQRGHQAQADDLQLGEVIGRGEFSEVRSGVYKGEPVAVKCMAVAAAPPAPDGSVAPARMPTEAEQAALTEEAEVMRALDHPNLVRFIDLRWHQGQTVLITELLSKGSLLNYLRSRGQSIIGAADQLKFAIDIASGMAYLAQKQLVHRDLAARNILLDDGCNAKVADFGLAKSFRDASQQSNGVQERIPLKWTAPECVQNHARFSTKSDVWSFAVLLWEIYTFGRMPYPRIKTDQVLKHVLNGYRMEMPERCPQEVYKLMRTCWELSPDDRPAFAEILTQLAVIQSQHKN